MNAIEKAITHLGSQVALARACNSKPQSITRWIKQGFPPVQHVFAIERATDGQVNRYELRPDIYPPEVFSKPSMPIPAPSTESGQSVGACGSD